MPLRGPTRFLTLLLAAIQLAVPAVVSVVDGAFAKQVRDPGSHVESSGGEECTPPHASDCTVCRYLSDAGVGDPPQPASIIVSEPQAPSAATIAPNGAVVRGLTRSRAPPAV